MHSKKKIDPTTKPPVRGSQTVLSSNEERIIVDTLILLARRGYGLPVSMLKQKVGIICSDGRNVPFNPDKGLGKTWFNGFLKRHSHRLSLRKGKIYEASRDALRDEDVLKRFYDEAKRVVEG